jgi:hypothetical protein
MTLIDHDDRVSSLERFANNVQPAPNNLPAVASAFHAPVERVHGAQRVAVKRNEAVILKQIKEMAAAAGEYWYYRYPVNNKGKKEYIEGPTIKCANAVSRMYGNCDVDCRYEDLGTHWAFHARFMDLETGYSLTRPLQQRKNQASMRGDAGRSEDIAHQIGTSKAIRNVVTNALDTFTTFAWHEAKLSVVETVGKNLERYKIKVSQRLEELNIDIHRVERVRGRPLKDWLATDVARTIAEIQAINDGMATADETFPVADEQKADAGEKLDQFAQGDETKSSGASTTGAADASASNIGPAGAGTAAANNDDQASQPDATSSPQSPASGATEGAGDGRGGSPAAASNAPASSSTKAETKAETNGPKTDVEYKAYAAKWIDETPNRDARMARWSQEKSMRNKANVSPETREFLEAQVKRKD